MSISCVAGSPSGGCKTELPQVREDIGRRIYIHEDALTALASQGEEQARLVYRMAARTVALKAVHHIQQDAAILGLEVSQGTVLLQETINIAWADNATRSLRRVAQRPNDPRTREHVIAVLSENEEIVASCYFSNYYTFATGAKTAELMFDDTNDIATLRRLKQETNQYDDMNLINGNCLILIDPQIGVGLAKASLYFKPLRTQALLSKDQLSDFKRIVYNETQCDLNRMIECSLDLQSASDIRAKEDVLKALDYAFAKGILKGSISATACMSA